MRGIIFIAQLHILMGEYEVVPPGTEHYIEAGEEGVAFFILIENVRDIPDHQIHLYEERA